MRINTKLAHISIILLFLHFFNVCLRRIYLSGVILRLLPDSSQTLLFTKAKPKDALFKSPQLVLSVQAKTLKVLAAFKDDEQ